jgi:hypothetical protein
MSWARTLWLFGAVLVACGFAVLGCLGALILWPGLADALLTLLPEGPPSWLTSLRIAVALAVVGVALGALGVLVTGRQAARMDAERRRVEDRLRRVHVYRDSSRREPFIGGRSAAGIHPAEAEKNALAGHRASR